MNLIIAWVHYFVFKNIIFYSHILQILFAFLCAYLNLSTPIKVTTLHIRYCNSTCSLLRNEFIFETETTTAMSFNKKTSDKYTVFSIAGFPSKEPNFWLRLTHMSQILVLIVKLETNNIVHNCFVCSRFIQWQRVNF